MSATAHGLRVIADGEPRLSPGSALIYALADPDTLLIRYIGQTSSPGRRKWVHASASNNRSDRKLCAWVRGLLANGRKPLMVELETTGEPDTREQHWIAEITAHGADLLNMNEGGKGTHQFSRPLQAFKAVTTKTPLHHTLTVLAGAERLFRKSGDHQRADAARGRYQMAKAAVKRAERQEGRREARDRINARLLLEHSGRFATLMKTNPEPTEN